jgi:hypothetical protein
VTIAVTPGYKKCHSRKPQQLLELATFVAARRMGVTLDDVSERFGSSRRTAQRIMHALEAQLKERKDAGDEATIRRLRELEEIATAAASTKQEPVRLNLVQPSEYGLFTILRAQAPAADEGYLADCARRMVGHLRANQLLSPVAGVIRLADGCASSSLYWQSLGTTATQSLVSIRMPGIHRS